MKSNQSQFKSLKYAAIALFAISSTNVIADQDFSTLDGIPAVAMNRTDMEATEGKSVGNNPYYLGSWGNFTVGGQVNSNSFLQIPQLIKNVKTQFQNTSRLAISPQAYIKSLNNYSNQNEIAKTQFNFMMSKYGPLFNAADQFSMGRPIRVWY